MILIDTLIHRLHGQLKEDFRSETARIGALNLIEATDYVEIKAFLDGLAYSERSTHELQSTRTLWTDFTDQRRR